MKNCVLQIGKYIPQEIPIEYEETFQMKIVRMSQEKLGLPKDLPIRKLSLEIDGNKPIKIMFEIETSIK